ncbi:Hypothetical predicted protein [Mytilus galloprovincialis]|uniref:Helitron helicase-like domain-containing protein n=1 Tax=Mytilus galloprovincialis TaxID=29158 RepID=A0A8B6FXW2_MYTGA|nr:Hypothetical predicted protein [Mytilus galloprovincialis]
MPDKMNDYRKHESERTSTEKKNIEERLLSLRIPFMQIRQLPRGGQLSVKGNVINVPVEVQPTINSIPHIYNREIRSLRNSPVYLEKRKKLFAMIRQLGLPTWFGSLSSADTNWKDLLRILGKLNDGKEYTDNELEEMDWNQKSKLVQKDPVTYSRYFDYRVQQFINLVLKSDHDPIGKLTDFFYRVEFQQRGSPHIHILI